MLLFFLLLGADQNVDDFPAEVGIVRLEVWVEGIELPPVGVAVAGNGVLFVGGIVAMIEIVSVRHSCGCGLCRSSVGHAEAKHKDDCEGREAFASTRSTTSRERHFVCTVD